MIVEKRSFSVPEFEFVAGAVLPVTVGYETYGTLNNDASNAILLCHYFSGSSHAAGTYAGDDRHEPGWWEPLIGLGKAFDTNRFFIICSDVMCNANARSPWVETTGPATIDPRTGIAYGYSFPQVTIRDFVRLQKRLLNSLGVTHLHCVAGPSMGAMQALQWAVDEPDFADRVIAVIGTGRTSAYTSVMPLQVGIDAIAHGGERGIYVAIKAMTIQGRSYPFAQRTWGHPAVQPASVGHEQTIKFHDDLDRLVESRAKYVEPLHWLYLSRTSQIYNLETGYDSYDDALRRIEADVLVIPVTTDLLFPREESMDLAQRLRDFGKSVTYWELDSMGGHLSGVFECNRMSDIVSAFLE